MPAPDHETLPWYAKGLRFRCARCGQCCTGPPGYVWVTRDEVAQMAAFLALTDREFSEMHCRRVWWRTSLKERPNGDCALLAAQGCGVHPARPIQCRTFPFWPGNLRSWRSWQVAKERCPGIGRGRLYSRQEVEQIAAAREGADEGPHGT